jgi:outer membrane protein assembly factor BamA
VQRVRIFYFRRGYRSATVDTTLLRSDDAVDVTFDIEEGAAVIVQSLGIVGLDEIEDAREIIADLPLVQGDPFSEVELDASREQIERELKNRGYAEAVVLFEASIPSTDRLSADVVLRAVPGPRSTFGRITVEGSTEVDPEDVRRLLTFNTGDIYNEAEVIRSQRQLYSMALFDYVSITTQPSGTDSTIDVSVGVNEARMRAVQLGFGISTTECMQVEAGWSHRNFFGGTRKLEFTGVLSNIGTNRLARQFPCTQAGVPLSEDEAVTNPFNKINWRLRADFQQPWFLGTENWLYLGVFTERQSLPGIYARVSYGGDIRFSREISEGAAVITTYRPGRDSLEEGSADFLFCANFGICNPDDIERISEPRWLSWVALTFAQSKTDAVLSPTRGFRWTAEGEFASRFTGSEWAYYRGAGEVSWYRRMATRSVLALHMRASFVRPIGSGLEGVTLRSTFEPVTHPLKRTYAGGAYTVRGYGQNLLGPKVLLADPRDLPGCDGNPITENNTWLCDPNAQGLTSGQAFPRPVGGENTVVGNIEVRFPLASDSWTGVAFLDLGGVWSITTVTGEPETFGWSPGFGVRYLSPVGPLRLDIAYSTGGTELLPVVSEQTIDGEINIVQLGRPDDTPILFPYNPYEDSGLPEFFSRLQLHFSIGHAF